MPTHDPLRLYRSIVAADTEAEVCWWYAGVSALCVPGYPEMPVLKVSAVMTYRTESASGDAFRIDWSEIGCFFDHATGEPPGAWRNPLTGEDVTPPVSFAEGPGAYTVSRSGDGLDIRLDQPHAQIDGVSVDIDVGETVHICQREEKRRGFPLADGTLPPPEAGFSAYTELHFFADTREEPFRVSGGIYAFELGGLPPWIGLPAEAGRMVTRGTITRARPGEVIDANAMRRLDALFPGRAAT